MAIWRQPAGPLNDSGKQGRFRQRQILYIFAEIGARGLGKTADGKGSALSQRNPVGVNLKDLLFRELLLQLDGDEHLGQLPLDGPFRGQEKPPRELHGQRGPALLIALPGHVDPGSFGEPHEVDPVVLEEAAVLDGQNRVDQNLGNLVILHHLALGALLALGEGRNHLRFEFIGIELRSGVSADAFDPSIPNPDCGRLGAVIGTRARLYLDAIAREVIAAHRTHARLVGVSGMAQRGCNCLQIRLFAYANAVRRRKNAGRVGEDRTAEALLDNPVVLYVKIGEKPNEDERARSKYGQGEAQHGITEAATGSFAAFSMRDSKLNSHGERRNYPSAQCFIALLCEMRWRENSFPALLGWPRSLQLL